MNISDISDFDIEAFKDWRKNYWLTGPGATKESIEYTRDGKTIKRNKLSSEMKPPAHNTMNKELTILRDVFEHARMKRVIEGREIPTIRNEKKPKNTTNKKPGLSELEVNHLLETLSARMKAQTNPKHKLHHKLLICYISFLCTTGLRKRKMLPLRIVLKSPKMEQHT